MFIEQAYKGTNTWWKVLITTLCIAGIFITNIIFYFTTSAEERAAGQKVLSTLSNNVALFINLLPFAFLVGLLFLLVRNVHHRSILSLTTSRGTVDYARIFFSFFVVVGLSISSFIISYYSDNSNIIWNFNPSKFLVLFLICCVGLPFQIGLEEYLFRGYLMQQIGIVVKNKWFPLVFTSVVFGLLHAANPEVAKFGFWVFCFYIGTGFLLGIMTLMDEGIELALGFHFANNLLAALIITADYSALKTDAIFRYTGLENKDDILNEMLLSMIIVYPIILFIFAKRYTWNNCRAKLAGKITPNTSQHFK